MDKVKDIVTTSAKSFWKDPVGTSINVGLQVLGISVGLYIILCCANCGTHIVTAAIQ
jgi:hypothetical protein